MFVENSEVIKKIKLKYTQNTNLSSKLLLFVVVVVVFRLLARCGILSPYLLLDG